MREAALMVAAGTIQTLDQLNDLLAAWLRLEYNERVHGATHEAPWTRFQRLLPTPHRISPDRLRDVFLWRETRRVDRTAVLQVEGNRYEVDQVLRGQKVTVRYDPYDLKTVHVEHDGTLYEARPLSLTHSTSRDLPPKHEDAAPTAPEPRLHYLDAVRLADEQQRVSAAGRLRYRGDA